MENQRTFWAAIVTMVMWVALTIISTLFMVMTDATAIGVAVFIIIMAGIGVGGTGVVWTGDAGNTAQYASPPQTESSSQRKSKRPDRRRLKNLMDELDDDQIVELEYLLTEQQNTFFDEP